MTSERMAAYQERLDKQRAETDALAATALFLRREGATFPEIARKMDVTQARGRDLFFRGMRRVFIEPVKARADAVGMPWERLLQMTINVAAFRGSGKSASVDEALEILTGLVDRWTPPEPLSPPAHKPDVIAVQEDVTPELRWGIPRWVSPKNSGEPRLQQKWLVTKTVNGVVADTVEEWRDVPFVALEE